MSPTSNNSSKFFFVQSIEESSIIPCCPSIVSISAENLFIFFIMDNFQPIDSSKIKSFKFLVHSELFSFLNKGPLHPFFLSKSTNPCLRDKVACS